MDVSVRQFPLCMSSSLVRLVFNFQLLLDCFRPIRRHAVFHLTNQLSGVDDGPYVGGARIIHTYMPRMQQTVGSCSGRWFGGTRKGILWANEKCHSARLSNLTRRTIHILYSEYDERKNRQSERCGAESVSFWSKITKVVFGTVPLFSVPVWMPYRTYRSTRYRY